MKPVPAFMTEDLRCCVCGNTEPDKFSLVYQKENFAVVNCSKCSFWFIPPYYRKQIEYTQYKNEAVTQAVRSGNNWVKIQRHKLRFRFIRKYIRKGRLFDLGAGWGHFMLAGKELGYDVHGIEIAEQPYKYCVEDLKLPVEHIDFFKYHPAEKYDIVTMWDVLEHIDKADTFLQHVNEITKSGGYLFLQVPQIDSYFSKRFRDRWKMMGLDHVNYFSRKTITQILETNGYEVLKIKSSFEIKLFIMYTILPYIKKKRSSAVNDASTSQKPVISAADRQNYFNKFTSRPKWQLKLFVGAHNLLYNTLSALNIGEEMMVAARKK
jgi:2-polyprenyl-3-methyl-5-hydroxy-6-metoxy-1,4-benzoquinol methylase